MKTPTTSTYYIETSIGVASYGVGFNAGWNDDMDNKKSGPPAVLLLSSLPFQV